MSSTASILLTAGSLAFRVMCGAFDELIASSELMMVVECDLWPGASILLTAGFGAANETAASTITRL